MEIGGAHLLPDRHGGEIGWRRTAARPWPAVRHRISTWEKPDATGSAPDRCLGPPLSAIGDEEGRRCSRCPSFSRHVCRNCHPPDAACSRRPSRWVFRAAMAAPCVGDGAPYFGASVVYGARYTCSV
ncbi:hypothetical protein ACLOJK_018647 [Asimina triloba]